MTFVDLQTYLEHISFFELVNVGVSLFHFVEIYSGSMKQPKYDWMRYLTIGWQLTLIPMYGLPT